ncbi:TetR/AcrR family transcriptional regulator [Micromonospora sp. NPDC049559]|uniref:TetR/AcrR family transcriptional regulator n=1 Tax=Micromonospora sp. NPDC049559 TaxID=3155923 RepID=UPI00343ABF4C
MAAEVTATELLWGERTAPRRGPRPTLTLESIAAAGIGIADAEGLAAVTMQRVAERLGVTKMALYRYVPGKVELVALMTDLAVGGPPRLDEVGDGWRPRLDAWARRMFERFWAHPWAIEATVGARAIGPNELGWLEQAAAALTGTGLTGSEILDVAATLVGHVRTVAQQGAAISAGSPERAMNDAVVGLLAGREDRFPALVAALADRGGEDQALDFGLRRILDGVELLIDRRR